MIDIDVSDLDHFPSALVAAFDFLGFKYMMQNADDLWRLGAQAKIVLDLIRATGEEETAFTFEGERSTSVPFVMNVSDTIIFVGPSNRPVDIIQFLWNAHQVMFYSIQAGMPLRGALCTGEILVSHERRLFLGPSWRRCPLSVFKSGQEHVCLVAWSNTSKQSVSPSDCSRWSFRIQFHGSQARQTVGRTTH